MSKKPLSHFLKEFIGLLHFFKAIYDRGFNWNLRRIGEIVKNNYPYTQL